jgi:serine/threonine-protein kinase
MDTFRNIFIGLLVVSIIQTILYFPQLPDVMASHFDGAGRPNGWMSKTAFFAIHLGMMALMALSFLYLPGGLSRFSFRMWSLPNREYWLSPERRHETFGIVRGEMLLMGIATVVFLIVVIQLAIEANLNPPPILSSTVGGLLFLYFAFTAVWLIRFFKRFGRVPQA